MVPSLTDEQIRILRNSAGPSAVRPPDQAVAPFDPRRSGQLVAEQMEGISTLHTAFALRVGSALGGLLRTGMEVAVTGVEQTSYGEFIGRQPEMAYVASIAARPFEVSAAVTIDLSLAFPMIDLILGGGGEEAVEPRELTAIEHGVFETVTQVICSELQSAWAALLEIGFRFQGSQQRSQATDLMSSTEKILAIGFEVSLLQVKGNMTLAFPSILCSALMEKCLKQVQSFEHANVKGNQARLQKKVLESSFLMELMLPPSKVSVRDLLTLEPGSVLRLQVGASEPGHLRVAGKTIFLASPVRSGSRRGAQVQKIWSIAPPQEREAT